MLTLHPKASAYPCRCSWLWKLSYTIISVQAYQWATSNDLVLPCARVTLQCPNALLHFCLVRRSSTTICILLSLSLLLSRRHPGAFARRLVATLSILTGPRKTESHGILREFYWNTGENVLARFVNNFEGARKSLQVAQIKLIGV